MLKKTLRRIFLWLFKVEVRGIGNWPLGTPVVLIANHVSLLDGLIVAAFSPAPLVFGIDPFYATRQPWKSGIAVLKRLGLGDFVPLGTGSSAATLQLIHALRAGRSVAIFPEGAISRTGELSVVHAGAGLLSYYGKAPLLPCRLYGLERTPFARCPGRKELFPHVVIEFFPPAFLAGGAQPPSRASMSRQISRLLASEF